VSRCEAAGIAARGSKARVRTSPTALDDLAFVEKLARPWLRKVGARDAEKEKKALEAQTECWVRRHFLGFAARDEQLKRKKSKGLSATAFEE